MYQATHGGTITERSLGVRFLIEAGDSNGTASVFECYVPARARMPAPHSHDGSEETIDGLEGVATWTINGETVEIGPGEAVLRAARADPRVSEPRQRRRDLPRDRHPASPRTT